MKLFRWTDPEWVAKFLRGDEMDPVNLTNSFRFAAEYWSVVCEFETRPDLETVKEDIRDRSPDLDSYRRLFVPESDVDGVEWAIGKGITHFRLAPESVGVVRVHYVARNSYDAIGDLVSANRAFMKMSKPAFARELAGAFVEDASSWEEKIAAFEKADARPDVRDFYEYGRLFPVEQVVHTEYAVVTLPVTDSQRESFWNRDPADPVFGKGCRHYVYNHR